VDPVKPVNRIEIKSEGRLRPADENRFVDVRIYLSPKAVVVCVMSLAVLGRLIEIVSQLVI